MSVARCAVCNWPLSDDAGGCRKGDCSMRPHPEHLADPERAVAEYTERLGAQLVPAQWRRQAESAARAEWLIYNRDYMAFWGPNRGGYFGLWGAGLYTKREAVRLASDKDRRDVVQHITEYKDQIANMRGAFERLSAAVEAAS